MMRYVYSVIMLACAVIAFHNASQIFKNQTYKKMTWRLFTMLSFASGVWSLGYGVMFFTDDIKVYQIFRIVGMMGIILIIIAGQFIMGVISGAIRKIQYLILIETLVGVIVVIIMAFPSSYTISVTPAGITTAFTSSTLAIVYTGYTVLVAVIFVCLSVYLASERFSNRFRSIGRALLKMLYLIGIGMVIDTVLPAFGINFNIPASTILQFFGLEIMKSAVLIFNRNTLDMANMATYISGSLKTPIMVFDQNHALKIANAESRSFFGINYEDMAPINADKFWNKRFGKNIKEMSFVEKKTYVLEEIDLYQGRNCKITIDPIYDIYDDYLGYLAAVTDVTKEKRYLKELYYTRDEAVVAMEAAEAARQEAERLRDEAESSNKAKTQFLANMSHEMRTPMNAIIGFSEMALRKEEEISPEALDYFKDINTSAKGLLSIINSILDISKIESGKVDIEDVVYSPSEIFDEISTVLGLLSSKKSLELKMNIANDIPKNVRGDKDKVREILYNLVNNAIKYTEEGSVIVDVKAINKKDDTIDLNFRIEDTGIGIKTEDLQSIFESFKRVDLELNKKTEGTGLGLSIVKGYVELLGGTISVESTYGDGSVFTVTIPQKIEEVEVVKAEEGEDQKAKRKLYLKDKRVLAVDDIAINLKVITELCKMYGITNCDKATSGKDAIELAKNNEYDIVFMDQMMPVMDGIEAMKNIRALGNGYENGGVRKIVALTANTMEGVRENMLEQGFDGFLGKPVNLGELEKVLEEFL